MKQRYQQQEDWTTEVPTYQDGSPNRRGKKMKRRPYRSKYTDELKKEIAEYSIKHGNRQAVAHFSRMLNTTVPMNTVLTLKYMYRKKMRMAAGYTRYGHLQSPSYFSNKDTSEIDSYFGSSYRPNVELPSKNISNSVTANRKRVYNKYTQAQRREMAEYSTKYGTYAASKYFSKILGTDVPAASIAHMRSKYNKWKRESYGENGRPGTPYYEYEGSPAEENEYEERNQKPLTNQFQAIQFAGNHWEVA